MAKLLINGGKKLKGEIATNSAKNSAVAILCATTMIKGKTTLVDMPIIEEVKRIIEILISIGLEINWVGKRKLEIINNGKINIKNLDKKAYLKTRSGFLLLGSLSSILNSFSLPRPGGCNLGKRTVNPHLIAINDLGIKIKEENSRYKITTKNPKGCDVVMYESSDTGTENVIMASSRIKGNTKIHFASPNYQVQDLCCFLKKAGAKIEGIGTTELKITGVKNLKPVKNYPIMPDPIESMTLISLAITTGSNLIIKNCPLAFLRLELEKLKVMRQKYKILKEYKSKNGHFDLIDIEIIPSKLKCQPDKIYGRPYPGLNMDNLPFFVPILTQTEGQTLVHDWPYENRAIYYMDLNRMGANLTLMDPHRIIISGPTKLKAADLVCPPVLRVATFLVICMLAAKGKSTLGGDIYQIERGYEDIVGRLQKLGADIQKIED